MALTGDQIEAVTASTVGLYQEAEQAILREITRRLRAGMDAPDWAVTRLGALATLRAATERVLGLVQAAGADQIRSTLAAAYRSGQGLATVGLPASLLRGDPDAGRLAAVIQQVPRVAAVESLAAALVDDIGARHSNVLRHVLDVYREVIQQATAVSIAGGQTRRQAAQHAYQRLVDQGVTSFVDSAGRRWRLSSYVEMATRTVTQRAAVQGQTDRLTSLGVDTVIVSDSPRECPKCRPWESKILSISGGIRGRVELPSMVGAGTVTVDIAGSLAAARAAGLFHPNCSHAARAFLPGATRRPTRPTENPDGYRAKERQREIERGIRKWKEREASALDPAAAAGARGKVRAWQGEMRKHLAANPELKRLSYREQIGAGNIPGPRTGGPGVSQPRPLTGGPGSPIQAEDLTPPTPPRPAPVTPRPPPPAPVDPFAAAATRQAALDTAPIRLTTGPAPELLGGGLDRRPRLAAAYALADYRGSWFQDINDQLRASATTAEIAEKVDALDAILAASHLNGDVVVERGFRPTPAFGADWATQDVTGWTWTDRAYGSSTADTAVAERFGHPRGPGRGGIVMRLLVPRGTGAIRLSDLGDASTREVAAEAEIMLERGLRYRVVADHGVVDGYRRVDVEVTRP